MALIETIGLTKHFGSVKALDKLDIEVEPGIIGLVGANGAGKSTLIKILLGLLPPTSGRATVLGMDAVPATRDIRQVVGYMPEHDCLPPDVGATEFVTHMARISGLPRTAARERTAEVLRHVGLYEERYRQIGGYSTGMKQRVKLAQALVHDPKLLLLDEPTNGLDPAGRDEMLDLIKRTGTDFGISVVVASHLLGEIEQVCTYLLAIDAGHLLQRGADLALHAADAGAGRRGRGGRRLAGRRPGCQGRAGHGRTALACWSRSNDDALYDSVRDAVADLALPLVRIEQERGRLEDIFRDAAPAGECPMTAPSRPGGGHAGRQHLRPRLPPLRGHAPRPALRHVVALRREPARRLGFRSADDGQGRALHPGRPVRAAGALPARLLVGLCAGDAAHGRSRSSCWPTATTSRPSTSS